MSEFSELGIIHRCTWQPQEWNRVPSKLVPEFKVDKKVIFRGGMYVWEDVEPIFHIPENIDTIMQNITSKTEILMPLDSFVLSFMIRFVKYI